MKSGFSLTEALITVTIIGIVAAMTLPIVVTNYQNDAFATHLQKFSQVLENAADYCTVNTSKSRFGNTIAFSKTHNCANCDNFMTKYMDAKIQSDIFASSYKSIDGTSVTDNLTCAHSYRLPDNISLCVTEKTTALGDFSPYYEMLIDLNGKSGPNTSGRDLFKLYIDEFGVVSGVQPDVTMENLEKAIQVLITNTSWECPSDFNIDANGDGNCSIDDLTYLIDLKLSAKPSSNKCTSSSDGSSCFSVLQDNSWVMDY